MDYKAHLFLNIGNGKLHPTRMQCGRHLYRNAKGTHVLKSKAFVLQYEVDNTSVCSKCLEWAKLNNKI
jgi:hypothetical protein